MSMSPTRRFLRAHIRDTFALMSPNSPRYDDLLTTVSSVHHMQPLSIEDVQHAWSYYSQLLGAGPTRPGATPATLLAVTLEPSIDTEICRTCGGPAPFDNRPAKGDNLCWSCCRGCK